MKDKDDLSYQGEAIKLDKVRHLKFTFRGMKLLAKKYGSVNAAMERISAMDSNMSADALDDLVNLVHAGLVHEDKSLTTEMVEDMLDFSVLYTIGDVILTAFMKSIPEPTADGGSEGTPGE